MSPRPPLLSRWPWALGTQWCISRDSKLCLPPTEIIFLRAIMPVYPANHADIIFDITEGNLRDSFDIIKRYMDGMTVGEWPGTFRSSQAKEARSTRLLGKPLWANPGSI